MPTPLSPSSSRFAATRWSIVLAAGDWRTAPASRKAMNDLAALYWYPLYAYLRRNGLPPHAAEDTVQGFFTHLLEKDALTSADRSKGKFRSFLLASLKNFHADQRDKEHAAKRGGRHQTLSLETTSAEARYAAEPVDQTTPDQLFQQQWARTIIDQVLARLKGDYAARNQQPLFNSLQHLLVGQPGALYSQIAAQLATTESAVKVAAHRLRRRFRELLREEVAQTVAGGADPALIDEEIRQLLSSL